MLWCFWFFDSRYSAIVDQSQPSYLRVIDLANYSFGEY